MIHKAYSTFTESLLRRPETGMGYQLIKAKRSNSDNNQLFIVYNAELVVDLDLSFNESKNRIQKEGFTMMLSQSQYIDLSLSSVMNRNELKSHRVLSESIMDDKGRHKGGSGAVDNDPVFANGIDIFIRLSAYKNDRRVDIKRNCLLDGTYTTTQLDYLRCKRHEDNPIDRYALPNNEDIKWAFYVLPKGIDQYRPGVVQPANGHNGGGIEALFDNGTSMEPFIKRLHTDEKVASRRKSSKSFIGTT